MNSNLSAVMERAIYEQLWLIYYNDTLYSKGIITEAERNKMRLKIKQRTDKMVR
jgi:hypothetical protein